MAPPSAANDRSGGLLLSAIYDEAPGFGADPWPFIVLMLAGFLIGIFGHIARTRALVALGIALIFLGTFVLPLVLSALRSQ